MSGSLGPFLLKRAVDEDIYFRLRRASIREATYLTVDVDVVEILSRISNRTRHRLFNVRKWLRWLAIQNDYKHLIKY